MGRGVLESRLSNVDRRRGDDDSMLIVGAADQVPGYAHGGVILSNDTKTKCWNGRVTERRRDSGWERARDRVQVRSG